MGNGVLSWSIYLYEYIYRFICRLPCLPLSLFYPILDFFHNMLSVAPITAECPNHFTSLSWWNGMEKMLAYTLNAPKKKKSTSSHAECKRVATLCTFTLAFGVWLSEKIYFCPSVLWAFFFFSFFFPGLANIYSAFELVCVCCGECLSISLLARDRSPTISFRRSKKVADDDFSVCLPRFSHFFYFTVYDSYLNFTSLKHSWVEVDYIKAVVVFSFAHLHEFPSAQPV